MADIIFIFSQYELLTRTAEYLSTLDLFHTALTCHELYTSILKSPQVFNKLKRVAICDGHGLKKRQGPDHWSLGKGFQNYINPWTGGPAEEEEIEVRLFNIQCDAFNALPCIKCGVNVCEECRYVPRIRNEDNEGYDARELPYCDASDQSHYLECYCPPCDEKMEQDLPLRLSHFCDCNQYTRWICYPCRQKEAEESADYYADHTTLYYGEDVEDHNDGIYIMEHQFDLAVCRPFIHFSLPQQAN